MKRLISLEDYVATTGVDDAGADAVEHVADVENAHLELCERDREVANISSALLQGCQHYCALRDVEAELQKDEVFQESVAKATMIAVEQMLSDMGKPKTGTMAVESISDTVKEVWKKLLEAMKRAWAHFKKWLDALFDVCQRLQKRARRMLKDLDSYGELVNPQPITNARLLSAIGNMTGTASDSAVMKEFGETATDVGRIYITLVQHMGKIQRGIREMITLYHRHAKDDAAAGEKAWKTFLQGTLASLYFDPGFYKAIGCKTSDAPGLQIEYTKLYTKVYPIGGGQFFGRLAASASDMDQHFGSIAHHCGFGIAPHPSKHHPDALQPLAGKRTIAYNLEESIKHLDMIMKTRDEGKKTIAEFERLVKDIKSGMSIEGVNPEFEAILVKVLVQSTTGLLNMTLSGERSLRMYQVKLVRFSLDYAAMTMRQLPKIKGTPALV